MNALASAIIFAAAIVTVIGVHIIVSEWRWRRSVARLQADNQRSSADQVRVGDIPHSFMRNEERQRDHG